MDIQKELETVFADCGTHGVAFPAAAWEAAADDDARLAVLAQARADIATCLAQRVPASGPGAARSEWALILRGKGPRMASPDTILTVGRR